MLVHEHPDKSKIFKCEKCKFRSRQKGNLKTHELIHKSKKEIEMFSCEFCALKTRQRGNYQAHILRKHSYLDKDLLEKAVYYLKCKKCLFRCKRKVDLKVGTNANS